MKSLRYSPSWVPVSLEPDPVIDAYKPGVDVTLFDANARLTFAQRLDQLVSMQAFFEQMQASKRHAAREAVE